MAIYLDLLPVLTPLFLGVHIALTIRAFNVAGEALTMAGIAAVIGAGACAIGVITCLVTPSAFPYAPVWGKVSAGLVLAHFLVHMVTERRPA